MKKNPRLLLMIRFLRCRRAGGGGCSAAPLPRATPAAPRPPFHEYWPRDWPIGPAIVPPLSAPISRSRPSSADLKRIIINATCILGLVPPRAIGPALGSRSTPTTSSSPPPYTSVSVTEGASVGRAAPRGSQTGGKQFVYKYFTAFVSKQPVYV